MNGCQESPMLEDARPVNPITLTEGKSKEIPLTQGKFAMVDSQDYEWLIKFKWHAQSNNGYTYYAARGELRPFASGKRNLFLMHREILGLPPSRSSDVDHKDGNGLHNCRENLRITTRSVNCQNRKIPRNNTSGFRGVCWSEREKNWRAQINVGKIRKSIGRYDTKEEAARAYDIAAKKEYGEEARINFPSPNGAKRYRFPTEVV